MVAQHIRIRQSASNLTPHERHQFVQNLKRMKTSGRYDWFVEMHAQVMNRSMDVMMIIPMGNGSSSDVQQKNSSTTSYDTGPMFLPWNRWFLSQFESELGMPIPYWEFTTVSAENDSVWSVWSDDFMGGDGDACGTVLTGPFAYANGWEIKVGVGTSQPGSQLIRMLGGRISRKPDLPSVKQISKILAMDSYEEVSRELESLYYYMHGWVGGPVSIETAPNDPIFWLIHSYIDLLWAQWQALYPKSAQFAPVSLMNQIMDFGDMRAATPANTINHVDLGYTYDKLKANLEKENNSVSTTPGSTKDNTKSNSFRKIADRLTRRKAPSPPLSSPSPPPAQQPMPASVSPVLPLKPTIAQPTTTSVPVATTAVTKTAPVVSSASVVEVQSPPTRREFNPRGLQRQMSFNQAQRTPNDSPVPQSSLKKSSPPPYRHEATYATRASPSPPVVDHSHRYSLPSHRHQSLDLTNAYHMEQPVVKQPPEQKRPFAPRSLPRKDSLPYPPSEQQNWKQQQLVQQHQPVVANIFDQPYPQDVPYMNNSNILPHVTSQSPSFPTTTAPYPLHQSPPQQNWQQQQHYSLPYPTENQQQPNFYGGFNSNSDLSRTYSSPQIPSYGYPSTQQQTPYPQQTQAFNPRGLPPPPQQQPQHRGYIPADEFFFS